MYQDIPSRRALESSLALHGLTLRGGFVPTVDDALEPLAQRKAVAVVWLVGVVGSAFWPHFQASAQYRDGLPDPLDRWSAAIGLALAERWEGRALFPFDGPPWLPFQQWADRCEPTQASRMQLRIHPEYGLWHAYRFALALPVLQPGDLQDAPRTSAALEASGICASCPDTPCLRTCPVDAYQASGFALEPCVAHLRQEAGAACMENGCQARLACPQGVQYRYSAQHAAFHMQAFLRSRIGADR